MGELATVGHITVDNLYTCSRVVVVMDIVCTVPGLSTDIFHSHIQVNKFVIKILFGSTNLVLTVKVFHLVVDTQRGIHQNLKQQNCALSSTQTCSSIFVTFSSYC